jgi:hypothetical protein
MAKRWPRKVAGGGAGTGWIHFRPLGACSGPEWVTTGDPVAITDFGSSIRKRSSKVRQASFRRPASPRHTRSAPPAPPTPPLGSPAPAPDAPVCRPSPDRPPTHGRSSASRRGGTRTSRPGSRYRPAPRLQTFQRRAQNVRLAITLRTLPRSLQQGARSPEADLVEAPPTLTPCAPGLRMPVL